jgi:hypothetical protein
MYNLVMMPTIEIIMNVVIMKINIYDNCLYHGNYSNDYSSNDGYDNNYNADYDNGYNNDDNDNEVYYGDGYHDLMIAMIMMTI